MFAKLFAEGGLSLERLHTLLEVSAAGSIVQAAGGDPVRQSQYSRQLKELEDFFQVKLLERHGKGIRLTANGRELARIARFFLMGLANFQRGCQGEAPVCRVGGSATALDHWVWPAIARMQAVKPGLRFVVEAVTDDEVERRLQELTLDFGVVTGAEVPRPLQSRLLGTWPLRLWTPRAWGADGKKLWRQIRAGERPLIGAPREMPPHPAWAGQEFRIECGSFLEVAAAMPAGKMAAWLPDFLRPVHSEDFVCHQIREAATFRQSARLVWNPRLLRLNPAWSRIRDGLLTMAVAPKA